MHAIFNSLKSRLFQWVLLASIPGIALLIYHGTQEKKDAITKAQHHAITIIDDVIHEQQKLIDSTNLFLQHLSQFPELQQPSAPECSQLLSKIVKLSNTYVNIGVPRADGELLCNAEPLTQRVNVADRPYIQHAIKTKHFSIGKFQTDRAAGITSINFAYPVLNAESNDVIALAVAVVSLDWWSERLSSQLPRHAIAYIVDAEKNVIATYPENKTLQGKPIDEIRINKKHTLLIPSLDSNVQLHEDDQGHIRVISNRNLIKANGNSPVNMMIGISIEDELSAIESHQTQTALFLLGFYVVFFSISMGALRKGVLNPINTLLAFTKRLEKGQNIVDSPSHGVPELVELQQRFSRMASIRLSAEQALRFTQSSLKESELRRFNHIQNTPLGYISWDKNFHCTEWNKAAERIFGYSQKEALGRHASELIIPTAIKDQINGIWSDLLKQSGGARSTNENVVKGGATITCEWYNTPIIDVSGVVTGVSSLIQDITSRIQTEENIRTTTALLEYSQAAAKVGGWELDLKTKELYWTAETYRIHDTSPEEFNPTVDAGVNLFLPESRERISKALQEAVDHGVGYELELKSYTTKGHLIDVYTTCTVTTENGNPIKLTGIFQDITERNQAKAKLLKEQLRLQSILDTAADGIILIDDKGKILSFNRSSEKIFQYSANDVLGKNVSMLMPEPFHSGHDTYLSNYKKTGHAKVIGKDREVSGKRANGEIFPLDLSVSRWLDGEKQMFTGAIRDISKQKQVQAQLIQTQKMESLSQLSAGLAHDFNNLLAIIMGNLDFLEMTLTNDEKSLKRISSALRAANRGADITKRMLRFSCLQSTLTTEALPQDANILLSEMVEILRRTLGTNFEISLSCESHPSWIRVDPAEFENVILNLGVNARDAMSDGGKITICTEDIRLAAEEIPGVEPGRWLHLGFCDNGSGIPKEICERIFEPFFTTKIGKGSGLGLAMAYSFAKQSNGHILIDSVEGEGTQINLFLPITDHSTADPTIKTDTNITTGNETILLVDDEPELLAIAEQQLIDLGYQVVSMTNAESALAILDERSDINLLLSDIIMPGGMLGTELAFRAQQRHPDLRVLLSSGFTQDLTTHPSYKKYANSILRKPYRKSDLAKKVREALDAPL